MKKFLLILSVFYIGVVFAQKPTTVVNSNVANVAQSTSQLNIGIDLPYNFNLGPIIVKPNNLYKKAPIYPGIIIGTTGYDLQTNASIHRRLILHANDHLSAAWTVAPNAENFPDRGTGYNYFGSSWKSTVSSRVESSRTGWPSIGVLKNSSGANIEFVMGHISATGGWVLSKNDAMGSSNFSNASTVLSQLNNKVSIWGRAASDNDSTIHIVSNYFADAAAGIPTVKINGVSSPTTYSRSTNKGVTWNKTFTALPGYDSTRTIAGGGDNYAIDVKGNRVAIVIGGLADDLVLWKSDDNGNTFKKIFVDSFSFAPFRKKLILAADREKTNDGSIDVIIDNDGMAHVFFGRSFVADEDTTDDNYSFFPGSASLMHWMEGWPTDSASVCGVAFDYDGNNELNIKPENTSFLDASGNLPGSVSSAVRYGSTSIVTMPSAGIDATGRIFLIYSAPVETSISPFNANYRDVYITFSENNGITWSLPQNVSGNSINSMESVFGTMAKRVNNFVHLMYQEDEYPGTNLQNNGNTNTHPATTNKIIYKAIPVTDIINNIVRDAVSTKSYKNDPKIFFVSQNQPNPFNSTTEATIYMRSADEVTLTITDISGKIISSKNLGMITAGNSKVEINAEGLSAGMYFYTLSTSLYNFTQKMQVK